MPQETQIHAGYEYTQQPDGSWRRGRAVSQGRVIADPAAPYEAPRAQADLGNTQANTNSTVVDTQFDQATFDARRRQAEAEAEQAELAVQEARRELEGGNVSETRRAELNDRISRLSQLQAQINRVQQLFDNGPGLTSGLGGLRDYAPSDANARFDAAGAALSQQGLAAFRVPGTGTVSDRDAMMFDRANLPTAGTRDSAVDEQLRGLRSRVDQERAALGLPPADWTATTNPRFQDGSQVGQAAGNIQPVLQETLANAMTVPRVVARDDQAVAAGAGAETTTDPVPPEYQQAHQQWVLQALASGSFTPEAYAAERRRLDDQFGYGYGQGYEDAGQSILDTLESGGTLNLQIPPVERELSGNGTDQLSALSALVNPLTAPAGLAAMMGDQRSLNDFVSSPTGTAMATAADAGGFGVPAMLAGDQFSALNSLNPNAAMAGSIGGAITGTSLLSGAARNTVGRAIPRLTRGGGGAQFGRNLATDMAYSGIYSNNTGGNVIEDTLIGGVGSGLGQGASRVAGAALSGVNVSPAVEYLRGRNIPLTAGQTLGGVASNIEERAMSIPFVGDMIRNRRLEGIDAFDSAALSDAGQSIGFQPTRTGREGVADLMGDRAAGTRGAINDAYDIAVAGQNFSLDPELINDMNLAAGRTGRLPPDLRANADQALANTFEPLANNGSISGQQWQGMRSNLSGYRAEQTGPGFPADYREIMTGGIDALDALAGRQGGPEVVQRLGEANTAFRLGSIVQDASSRADGAGYQFTPSQLQDAIKASQRRFPGQNPLLDLADAGQQVLPNRIPNSGTADRIGQMALGGAGLTAVGAGGGYAAGGNEGAATGAALPTAAVLLAALGGTRQGQRLITGALTANRPDAVRLIGDQLGRRAGLFGSAMAAPLVIAPNNY